MSSKMTGRVRRDRKIDPNGNIYYDRGVSDIIFDPIRGVSVKDDIDELRKGLKAALEFVAANPKGMDGLSAYEIAVEHGFSGTEYEWLQSLIGKPGTDGLNAYELAVIYSGFEGSMFQWLESLKGEKGDKGDDNYQIAVRNGYTGTEKEWIDSMLNRALTDEEITAIYRRVVGETAEDGGDYAGLASSIKSINQKIGVMDDALQETMVDVQINNETNILTGYKTNGTEFNRRIAVMATESDVDDLTDGYVPSTGSSVNGKDLAVITTEEIDDVTETVAATNTDQYSAEFNALMDEMVASGNVIIEDTDGKEGE